MEYVLKAIFLYFFILIVLRIAGKRTVAEITTFDMVFLLLIAETADTALFEDFQSLINAALVISTFVILEILLAFIKQRSKRIDEIIEGKAVFIVERGEFLKGAAKKEKVDKEDILMEARRQHGLEKLSEIKYAILEKSGGITVVPKK